MLGSETSQCSAHFLPTEVTLPSKKQRWRGHCRPILAASLGWSVDAARVHFFVNSDWNWWNPQHFVAPGHCPDIPWIENVSELPVTSLLPSSEVSTWSWAYCFTLVWMGYYLLMISWKHAKRTQEQKKEKAVCKKCWWKCLLCYLEQHVSNFFLSQQTG